MSAASTYAEALFAAARERDELEGVLEDVQEFGTALDESEELRLFFYFPIPILCTTWKIFPSVCIDGAMIISASCISRIFCAPREPIEV